MLMQNLDGMHIMSSYTNFLVYVCSYLRTGQIKCILLADLSRRSRFGDIYKKNTNQVGATLQFDQYTQFLKYSLLPLFLFERYVSDIYSSANLYLFYFLLLKLHIILHHHSNMLTMKISFLLLALLYTANCLESHSGWHQGKISVGLFIKDLFLG